jgi:predicted nucleic acid-binding protein
MTASTASTPGEMVDTNILIYAADPMAGGRGSCARELIRDLIDRKALTVSVQVLNKFYVVATRPHKPPSLSHADASQVVRDLADSSTVVPLTQAVTLRALEALPRHGLSFWDALIWAAAKENGVSTIYTEDFQDGRDVEGVRFVNPFTVGA